MINTCSIANKSFIQKKDFILKNMVENKLEEIESVAILQDLNTGLKEKLNKI